MRLRHHAIGLFVACHLAVVGVVGLGPAPKGKDRPAGVVGAMADGWNGLRDPVRTAVGPATRMLGNRQGWVMFRRVSRNTLRLTIEAKGPAGWEPIYVSRSPTATWHRRLFDDYRWREQLNHLMGRKRTWPWPRFVEWVAEDALADHPNASAVRIQVHRNRIEPPHVLSRTRTMRFETLVKSDVVPRDAP